jgi:DNA polymerase-3 subunit beta
MMCNRQAMVAALASALSITKRQTPLEILKYAMVTCAGGVAVVRASNTELHISVQVPDCDGDLEPTLLGQRALHALKESADDVVKIIRDGDHVVIATGTDRFQLQGSLTDEFPSVPEFKPSATFTVHASTLAAAMAKVESSVDEKSGRYALGGVLIDAAATGVSLVATDSRMLSVTGLCDKNVAIGKNVVAQPQGLKCDDSSEVEIAVGDSLIAVRGSRTEIVSRRIEGRFPNWRDVVPRSPKVTLSVPAKQLTAALRRAMVCTNEETRGVEIEAKAGTLRISSAAKDVGESDVTLPIPDDVEFSITLDPKFAIKATQAIGDDLATIEWTDADAVVVISGNNSRHAIAPLARD